MESQNKSSIPEIASNSNAITLISNSNSTDTSLLTSEYTTPMSESNGNVTVFNPVSGNNSEIVFINQTNSSPAMNGTSEKQAVTEVAAGSTNSTMVLTPEAVLDQESSTSVSASASETQSNSSTLLSSGTTKINSSTDQALESRTLPVSTPEMTQLSSDEGGCSCTVTTLSSPGHGTKPELQVQGVTPMSGAPVADMASVTPSPTMCSCPPSQETSVVSGSTTTTTTTASSSESTAPVTMATSANMMDSSIEPEHTNLSADPVQSATPVNVVEVVTQKQAGFLPAPISVTLKVK